MNDLPNLIAEMALNIDTVTGTIHEHFPEDLRSIQRFKQETFILDGMQIIFWQHRD